MLLIAEGFTFCYECYRQDIPVVRLGDVDKDGFHNQESGADLCAECLREALVLLEQWERGMAREVKVIEAKIVVKVEMGGVTKERVFDVAAWETRRGVRLQAGIGEEKVMLLNGDVLTIVFELDAGDIGGDEEKEDAPGVTADDLLWEPVTGNDIVSVILMDEEE